jgi:transketolase
MRKALVQAVIDLAKRDDRIAFLTGDLGYMALEPVREALGRKFFNVGVAEQNMVGMATGLAEAGFVPFVYSIAPFAALRPFEFIRNGPALHRLPVRVVGMGMGFEYGHAGPTHYAIEDVGVMRTLTGVCTVIPADAPQAYRAIMATSDLNCPVYYSLGKDDRNVVPELDGQFALQRIQTIGNGNAAAIITMGSISREAVSAAAELRARGIDTTVAVVSAFNPSPEDDLAALLARVPMAISVEAHVATAGVGSLAAQIIAERALRCRLRMLGVRLSPDGRSGSQPAMWRKHGIDRASIVSAVLHAANRTEM